MKPTDAIREMVAGSGKNATVVSQDMGRSGEYIRSTLANSRHPSMSVLNAVAKACGYDAELVNEKTGEVIRIK